MIRFFVFLRISCDPFWETHMDSVEFCPISYGPWSDEVQELVVHFSQARFSPVWIICGQGWITSEVLGGQMPWKHHFTRTLSKPLQYSQAYTCNYR